MIEVFPKSYDMDQEERLISWAVAQCRSAAPGSTLLLPEYLCFTHEMSARAESELATAAETHGVNVITTLNLPAPADLPAAVAGARYNTLTVFTRHGRVHHPQAKCSPQSFEQRVYHEQSPLINVSPYTQINVVEFCQQGACEPVVFLICSDLAMVLIHLPDLSVFRQASAIIPGNFGRGAERAVERVCRGLLAGGMFQRMVFSNAGQNPRPGRQPLCVAAEWEQRRQTETLTLTDWQRIELFRQNVLVYPDAALPTFVVMAAHTPTDEGRMTFPMSVLGATGTIGAYPETILL